MRADLVFIAVSLFTSAAATAIGVPPQNVKRVDISHNTDEHDLFKRRGGGGGGGRGGGGGGSSSGKSGGTRTGGSRTGGSNSHSGKSGSSWTKSGSSSSSGGSSKSGSSSSSSGSSNTGSRSNSGGTSSKGSGPQPSYGGGRYYAGGASVPYKAGSKTPGGLLPFFLVGGALAFWPGVWLYGAYMYHYDNPYRFYNVTSKNNETLEVICGCARFAVCGCNNVNDTSYYDQLVGNGSYDALNKSIVTVARVNGSETLLINGTLPNGTTVEGDSSAAGGDMRSMIEAIGFWPVVAIVMATVFLA